jgi:hypothetical protein
VYSFELSGWYSIAERISWRIGDSIFQVEALCVLVIPMTIRAAMQML